MPSSSSSSSSFAIVITSSHPMPFANKSRPSTPLPPPTSKQSMSSTYRRIRIHLLEFVHVAWVAALLVALARVVAAVALLALLDNLVAAEGSVVLLEAVLLALVVEHGVQHRRDVVDRAVRKFVVVGALAAGGRRVHDEVAQLAARPTLRWEVVRRAKVVADLVRQRQLAHLGRHTRVVVDKGDDARVQTSLRLHLPPANVLGVRLVLFANATRGPCVGWVKEKTEI